MKMTDFVVKEAIVPDLQANTKEAAIRALVDSLRKSGSIRAEDEQSIVAAILKDGPMFSITLYSKWWVLPQLTVVGLSAILLHYKG